MLEDRDYLIERAIIYMVAKLVDDKKLPGIDSHRDFAMRAFPKYGEKLWKSLRIGQNGKPQALSVECANAIARTIGMSLSDLIIRANILIEDGWTIADDTINNKRPRGFAKKMQSTEEIPPVASDDGSVDEDGTVTP